MPTGYTAAIKDGISFEEYAIGCARAFGACIMRKDEPNDAKIPEKFESSTYHLDKIETSKKYLDKFTKMSKEEIRQSNNEEQIKKDELYMQSLKEMLDLNLKYNEMLEQVNLWIPPSEDHKNFKEFMVDQIKKSIEFDVYEPTKPEPISDEEWHKQQINSAQRDIEYHTKEHKKEIERTSGRNEWISQLRESLK